MASLKITGRHVGQLKVHLQVAHPWSKFRATRFVGRHNIFKKLGIHHRISLPEFVKPVGASELESTGSVRKTA